MHTIIQISTFLYNWFMFFATPGDVIASFTVDTLSIRELTMNSIVCVKFDSGDTMIARPVSVLVTTSDGDAKGELNTLSLLMPYNSVGKICPPLTALSLIQ